MRHYTASSSGRKPRRMRASTPIGAAQNYASAKKLRSGIEVQIVDRRRKVRIYKVGVVPRSLTCVGVLDVNREVFVS